MINIGEKCKVFIEKPNGTLMELTSVVESFSIAHKLEPVRSASFGDCYIPGSVEMDIKLCGISPLIMTTGKELSSKVKNDLEWKCDYCGRPNKRERETCESCGSVRSFIYA